MKSTQHSRDSPTRAIHSNLHFGNQLVWGASTYTLLTMPTSLQVPTYCRQIYNLVILYLTSTVLMLRRYPLKR